MEELELQATKIGLPLLEAKKFFCFYESKGWRVGKNLMRNWRIAMGGWKLRWEEKRQPSPSMRAYIHQKELERVMEKMKSIRNSYMEHQGWDALDKAKFNELKARKLQLQELLGVKV